MNHLGITRSVRRPAYLLQTRDSFVRTSMPGLVGGMAIVHAGPAAGARFAQSTVEFDGPGMLSMPGAQCFLYVLAGECTLRGGAETQHLKPGSFAYLPAASMQALECKGPARVAMIEKPYVPWKGVEAPPARGGHEAEVAAAPLLGDDAVRVRSLLPASPAFDFQMNTMTYQPGASLSQVEMHVMEHGLLMLEGAGIYRLGEEWYPVEAGDFIWMAPFCPQWFGALGKVPAKYLIYKDAHRSPLA